MAEEEGSALDLEGFEKQLQSLFTNGCSSHALQVDGKTFCSEFRKLVEEYTCHWQTPLPQLRILEIALCYFDRESYSFPVGCDDVHYMLSSLALSVFELLLFFEKNDFHQDPLKHFTVTFQECHTSLVRHQNVHFLEVSNCLQDGGPWGNITLQSILTQSTLHQTEVDQYISSQLPVFLELRVRYLLTCERVSEAMALAKCCSQHPTAGEHPFFLQVYLTWLHKTSQNDLLNKELANLNGEDALHVICNMEGEEEDESLLALTRALLSQELRRGDMDHLCDLVFIWSKLNLRLKSSKDVLLEESHELMLSATNVNSIFPFIRVILEELGNDGLPFCVELCTKALQSCDDVGSKSLIYKTIAGLFPNDLEICRACALLVYFLEPKVEAYKMVFLLYTQPDQEYNADDSPVSNQVRFELFQVLKKGMHFDPEFCDLIALRANCKNLMSEAAESAALEEILEWVPDYCIKEPDLHLNIHSSNFQQRTEVAHQAGAKKRQTKDDKKNHITTERGTANTDVAAASSVNHTVMTKEKHAVNETPALDSLWQSFWQLDKMYHKMYPIPPRFSEKTLMEYSETAEDLKKASTSLETLEDLDEASTSSETPEVIDEASTSSETPEVLDEASTSLPSGKPPRPIENSETHEDLEEASSETPEYLDKASTSLLTKIKPAVVILSRLPRINKASTLLLVKMKSAVVVLDRLPQINEASASLLVNEAVLGKLPQIDKASCSLLVNEAVLPKLPQLHKASSSLLVNETVLNKLVVVLERLPQPQIDMGNRSSSLLPKMKPAVVVLSRLPRINKASSSLLAKMKPVAVVLPKLPQLHEATSSLLVNEAVLPKLPQVDETSSSLLVNEAGSISPSQTPPAVVVLPEHGSQDEGEDTVSVGFDTCWAPIHRRHKSETLTPQANPNGLKSAAPELRRRDETSQGRDSPHPVRVEHVVGPKRRQQRQRLRLVVLQLPSESLAKVRKLNKDAPFKTLTLQANANAVRSESSQTQPFSCPECLYAFTSQDFLHKHMKRSHSELYCQMLRNGQIPSAAFKQITSPAASQKQGDTDDPGSYSHQQLTKTLSLKTPELTSSGKRLHTCKLCEKSFRNVSDLKRHMPVHSGEQPFKCKYCGKSFNDQSNLRKHERIHTGKKSYHCTQCGKAFSRMDCLKIHMRAHTGEKTFHCEQCDKSFSQLGLLKTHQRLHTGEKPFQCKWCDMSFNESGNLKRHHQCMHA